MAVGLKAPADLIAVPGVRLASTHCGIKPDPAIKDLTLIECAVGASIVAVFTQNRFCAAPVTVAREHLSANLETRFLLINSGNANAGTGDQGLQAAYRCCTDLAKLTDVDSRSVLPFSTGVIATQLEDQFIRAALPSLLADLKENNWLDAANGIMTTDTLPKVISRQLLIDGKPVTISGMAKGSGMIKPNMATMLGFIATDARVDQTILDGLLQTLVSESFNSITVDGDTSTNDACLLIASGASGVVLNERNHDFVDALTEVFQLLAQAIIRDAEGATKFVEIEVKQALSVDDAREIAFTIAHSPLVKTAMFASDPNWGRILAAIGRAPVDQLEIDQLDLYLGQTCLLKQGLPDPNYREEAGQREMDRDEIKITVDLNAGSANARIWTSDLSYDYVKINAEYRS